MVTFTVSMALLAIVALLGGVIALVLCGFVSFMAILGSSKYGLIGGLGGMMLSLLAIIWGVVEIVSHAR